MKLNTQIAAFVAFLSLAALLTSCQGSYQLIAMEPSIKSSKVSANDPLTASYDFWNQGLYVSFTLTNNTDSLITIDIAKSMFVINGYSNSYYRPQVHTVTGTISRSSAYSWRGASASNSVSTTEYEKDIVYIAPHSKINLSSSNIIGSPFKICEADKFSGLTFDEKSTPYNIQNYISYRIGSVGGTKAIHDGFYLSKVRTIRTSDFYQYVQPTGCPENQSEFIEKVRVTSFRANNRFFFPPQR